MALPLLESVHARVAETSRIQPQRMLLISNNFGVLPKPFFPKTSGKDYELSPYLQNLKEYRNDFTVFSGLSHLAVEGGHSAEKCFLAAAKHPTSSGFRLAETQDESGRLLDSAMILYGSNMGDANTHDNRNLPILLAGGGFKHGQHLAFDRDNNAPLSNLYVSMLEKMGVETDGFGASTGTLTGLSLKA